MKSFIVDQIEITRCGFVQVRFHKLSSDGALLGNHRTSIEPGGNIDKQFAAVNAHLAQEGFAPLAENELDRVRRHVIVAHTPEVVAAYKAELARRAQ